MGCDIQLYTSELFRITTDSMERERKIRAAAEDRIKVVIHERDEQIKAEQDWFDKRVRELKIIYHMPIAESAGK
jgi:hypothetical protein